MYEDLDLELPPKDELLRRIGKLRERMDEKAISVSIILQHVDIYYFTGTMQRSILVVPLDGEVLFFVEKSVERARMESPFEPLEGAREKRVAEMLSGRLRGRCGMELDVLPVKVFQKWRALFPSCEFVDLSGILREIRMVKSEYEIEQIRRSGMIVDHVFEKAREVIREGATELEVASTLEAEGRKRGHQGFLRMRGFNNEMMNIHVIHGESGTLPPPADVPVSGVGLTPAVPYGPSLRRIGKGTPTIVDYGGGYNGYVTDETRTFVIGALDEAFKRPYEVALEIIEDISSLGKEGVDGREIFLRAYSKAKGAGLEEFFMGFGQGKVSFLGHGLGLEINELPVITKKHGVVLQEGMVFACEPKFTIPHKGAIGIEVDFIVKKHGLERVTKTPIELVCL